ncbi:MAG TPA: beta-galactosidase [Clostridiaceae bacterium]|nr:beta-galactosidase [Clostridiaceae bacterium]
MREKIHLNEGWMFYRDVSIEGYFSGEVEGKHVEMVDVPHTVQMLPYHYFNEEMYQFQSVYEKEVFFQEDQEKKRMILTFEGVANSAVVYINGVLSFHSESPYVPFSKDISGEVRLGQLNTIVVLVDSRELPFIPPFGGVVDYLSFGGIYRGVHLEMKPRECIEEVFAYGASVLEKEKKLLIETAVQGAYQGSLVYKLFDEEEDPSMEKPIFTGVRRIDQQRVKNTFLVKDVDLWGLTHPKRYTLKTMLMNQEGTLLDVQYEKIGFREALFKDDGFYLNGVKTKIRGLNRHQSYPYVGYAMPKSMQRWDAKILKEDLGVNLVRTSHYPQAKEFLEACDELGLLVFEEIPGWQHIGDEQFKEISKYNLKRMIKRDRNHPSVIIWGVRINESQDDHTFYAEMNKIARLYDPSRPTGGVRNFAKSELLEDVYTYNDFVHQGHNQGLRHPKDVLPRKAPYLVTEFNGHMFPTKSFDPEKHRLDHALRHSKVLEAMEDHEALSGVIGWCMNDYQTHGDFGSGDRICYHGVLDGFRQKKLAAYVYAAQQRADPVLMVSSSMNIGEHPGGDLGTVYAFTNCDAVEVYKNDQFIKRYERKKDKGVFTVPIAMEDFIGDRLEVEEGFSPKDAEKVKEILKAAAVHGTQLPMMLKASMGWILWKYKLQLSDAMNLFGKYYSGWGQDQWVYTFKGLLGGKEVLTVKRGPSKEHHLRVTPSHRALQVEETYDVAMVSLQVVNEHGDQLSYSNELLEVMVEGPLEIVGPKRFPLRGGQGAFYVRTKGEGASGQVTVLSETMGEVVVTFTINKKPVQRG